jgi:hypothetical protein
MSIDDGSSEVEDPFDDEEDPINIGSDNEEDELSDSDSPFSTSLNGGLIPGSNDGFYIVKTYKTDQSSGFDLQKLWTMVAPNEMDRLDLTARNITVPLALMLLDPEEYPTTSRARKACRKAHIMIHRGALGANDDGEQVFFDRNKCVRARVGDRVFPGDVLAKQVRISEGRYPVLGYKKPPFDLPVVFEDDHFAIGKQEVCTRMILYDTFICSHS